MNRSLLLPMVLIFIFIVGCTHTRIEYWRNGIKKSEIHFRNDRYEGKASYWYEDGKLQLECFYKNNLLDSIMTRWYNTGIKQEEAHYKNNKLDGTTITWDKKGNLESNSIYNNGVLNGPYREWYGDGTKKVEGNFSNGNYDGYWMYFDYMGTIIGEGIFINGNGNQKAYFDNGQLKEETSYRNNLKDGQDVCYELNGKVEKIRIYKADSLITIDIK